MNIESVNIGENSLGKMYALKYTKEYKNQKYKYKLQQKLLIIDYLSSIRMSEDEIVKVLKRDNAMDFMEFIELLTVNNLTLDEDGNVVEEEKENE